jgi:pimeloyl-ACP methyl ester carboxylesterase
MPFFEHDGLRLHFLEEGEGVPLLLLHGFPLSAESFRQTLGTYVHGIRLIALDHRGFGRSAADASTSVTMETYARDALALLDHLDVRGAFVGGVSMGGYVAMALARLAIDRVYGLVLIDTQASADDEAAKARREDTAKKVLAGGSAVLVDALLPKLFSEAAPAATRRATEAMIREASAAGAAAALRGMALRSDSNDVLAAFGGPALVIVGEKDEITPLAKAEEMLERLARGRLEVLPGAGHLSNQEAPDAFHRVLYPFLGSGSTLD